ncbi:MAG: hypothetical protein WA632_07315, partial [Gallionella sp.]
MFFPRDWQKNRRYASGMELFALARIPVVTDALDEIFDRYDAIITPATSGSAPLGLESTGNPMYCTLWTFCG